MKTLACSFLCELFATAGCASSNAAPIDASVPPVDAGVENDGAADGGFPILPYPPGPYGGGIGDIVPDFRVQGFALSRAQRDSSKLTFRDISLAEVRSDPACSCLVLVRNAVGAQCFPCLREDRALVAALDAEPGLCALEVVDQNSDGVSGSDNVHPPTRADLEDFTRAQRENFPVGILTDQGNVALTAGAINLYPILYVVSPKDMRMIGFHGGAPLNLSATVNAICKNGPFNPVETLATGLSPRRLLIDATHAYMSDHNAGIVRVPLAGGAPESVAKPASTPEAIALDASRVCWATHEGGASFEVACANKTGGAPTVLTSGALGYFGVATDGTNAYFTRADGVVGSVPLGGGPVTVLSSAEAQPTMVQVDDADVFWIEAGTSSVVKVPKSGGARSVLVTPATITKGNAPREIMLHGEDLMVLGAKPGSRLGTIDKFTKTGTFVRNVDLWNGPTTIASDPNDALLFGTTDGTVENFGIVAACRTNGFPDIVTMGQRNVTGIAGDATRMYWITNDDDVRANRGALKRSRRVTSTEVPP